ncbi:hypothetical protein [Actinophytocola xanthii]|nr:hypothetical protein [Actinophytocola xanthii]
MGVVIQIVADEAEGGPRTGVVLGLSDIAASGDLGAKTAFEGFEDAP